MTTQKRQEKRTPEEIESEIHQTRERLDDTLHDLEEKLSPKHLLSDSFDYIRHGGANDFFANLGNNIRQNPMPVTVAGLGLGWLMVSSMKRSHADRSASYELDAHRSIGARPLTDPQGMGHSASPGSSYSSEPSKATDTATANRHSRGSVGAGATSSGTDPAWVGNTGTPSRMESTQGRGKSKMQTAKEKAKHMSDRTHSRTGRLKERSQTTMGNMTHRAQNAGTQLSNFVHDYPLVAGALGLALGAALGSLLPSTRSEDKYFGEMRDRTLDKASEAGNRQADKAQSKVHERTHHSSPTSHTSPATSPPFGTTETSTTETSTTGTSPSGSFGSSSTSSAMPSDPSKDGPPVRGG